jgi:hypothetical protein
MRLRYSEVTPEKLYLSRRELMAGAMALAVVGCDAGTAATAAAPAARTSAGSSASVASWTIAATGRPSRSTSV